MRILAITDIHGDRNMLERILTDASGPWDLVLLGGDLTHFGSPEDAEWIVERCRELAGSLFAVADNCDSRAIDDRLTALGVSVFQSGRVLEGIGFYGVSAMPPWHGTMYELTEQEIATALADGAQEVDGVERRLVLSHPPPRDTLCDRTAAGRHVGSAAVREHVEHEQPLAVVCGHIHEARGIDQIGGTRVINCGEARRGFYAELRLNEGLDVTLLKAEWTR